MPHPSDRLSLWLDQPEQAAAPATLHDVRSLAPDVIVVGGGLAGLCTAWRLLSDGLRVALVEADRIASRTTGHSTAKVTALQGTTYSSLKQGKGAEAAAIYADVSMAGVRALRSLVAELGIDCSLTAAPAYTCAAGDAGVPMIEAETEAARAAGLAVEHTTVTDLPFPIAAAVRLDDQAHFDPVAFCRGLAHHLLARGAVIVEGTRVNAVEEDGSGCTVRLADGELSAAHVVITTHLPVTDPALLAGRTHPDRSYAVAGAVAPDTPPAAIAGMYLAADEGWSIRPWGREGRPGLVVGGEGHSMQQHVETREHYERLQSWAGERLAVAVQHSWSAFDYTPVDGVPFIGRLAPRSSRRFVATGFRKWGMSTSMVAAELIGDLIAGREHPAHELFDATRLLPTLRRDAVVANARVARRFVGDRLQAPPPGSIDEMERGEGRVVRVGRRFVAAARDFDGELHTVQAACTHLGCLVEFNGGDQTWDCPCHGSRFALDGTVIDGPASAPLAPAELPPAE